MLDDLQLFRTLAVPLSRPNATYTSILQVAKRVRLADDKIRRGIARLEERTRTRLVVTQGRRLVLTPAGLQLADIARQIDALAEGTTTDDGPESFVIDADPVLAETLLPLAFPDFFSLYADAVKVEVCPFDPVATPERLDNGTTHLALAWADPDGHPADGRIDASVRWSVVLPEAQGFAKREVAGGGLAQFDRVFVVADERTLAATASALHAVMPARRIECPSVAAVLAAVASGCGVGVVPWVPWRNSPGLRAVPLTEVEAESPAVFVPRRGADLTDAADSLRTILKRIAVESPPSAGPSLPTGEFPAETDALVNA